ncbi:hypothetical protein ACKZDW_03610 (plasmid) [Ralstonia syzygii subsp. celebesensis]|uniref:hypothetical protein n=1 Tax=Ralstonia solanacearum species complex TaxID=3116862 RepID=UPI001E457034|nr:MULTISPECIES: hypothetical protein [Ralstonia solanacearum species complex]
MHTHASRAAPEARRAIRLHPMFCICSDKSIDDILSAQRDIPLPFEDMLECYTRCLSGCGSCIDRIRERVKDSQLFFEAEQQT